MRTGFDRKGRRELNESGVQIERKRGPFGDESTCYGAIRLRLNPLLWWCFSRLSPPSSTQDRSIGMDDCDRKTLKLAQVDQKNAIHPSLNQRRKPRKKA